MNTHNAIMQATEIVKAAVQAGWLKAENGAVLGDQVSIALEKITRSLLDINDKPRG